MESLKEKYQKELNELNQNIPMLEKIVAKPFNKEDELGQLKKDVSKLEREITLKIQANQIKQHEAVEAAVETPVVKLEIKTQKDEKSLLAKRKVSEGKTKGIRI